MPSEVSKAKVNREEPLAGVFHPHARNGSLPVQFPQSAKGKSVCSKGSQNIDLLDKAGALRTRELYVQADSERNMPYERSIARNNSLKGRTSISTIGVCQKPRPNKKLNGEEMVKHMSHLPRYLQRREKEDNVQDKALNFGVLDWGLLERWAYHQKCSASGEQGQSRSSTSEFLPVSTAGSSSNLGRTQSKLYSSRFPCGKPIIGTAQLKEKSESSNLSTHTSNLHDKHHNTDCNLSTERSRCKNSKCDMQDLESKDMPSKAMMLPLATSRLTLNKDNDTLEKANDDTFSRNNLVQDRDGILKKKDKMQGYHQWLILAVDVPKSLENGKCMQDHVRTKDEENHLKIESSSRKNSWLVEQKDDGFADMLSEDVMCMHRMPDVPFSCPLPQNIIDKPDTLNTFPSDSALPTEVPTCGNSNHVEWSFICKTQKPHQCEGKAMNVGGKPHNVLSTSASKWMSRSSSLKESLIERELKPSAGPDKLEGNKASKSNKGRQSPLRRMLDPLLKPKSHLFSGRIAASPGRHSYEPSKSDTSLIWQEMGYRNELHKSSDTSTSSNCQAKVDMDMPIGESNNCSRSFHFDRHAASRRQALLQLAWKNGFPLFMLSSSDNEVLVATISSKCSTKDDMDCVYTVFSVNESKKKRMLWSNTGNKGKNNKLVSSIVGQIKVSTSQIKSDQFLDHHVVKEFVLIGTELAPKSTENVEFPQKSELAAVVVNVPRERPVKCTTDTLSSGRFGDGKWTPTDENSDRLNAPGILVILPSSVHGLSTDGGPSPLIQRWRSGGACDCGGWDEGCTLTILKDKSQADNIFDSLQFGKMMDGSQRFEFFVQGRPREKHPAFSIVSFNESLYTIDFIPSIALVQAFSICIATLHARNPNKGPAEINSLHDNLVNHELLMTPGRSRLVDATSYVPNCPPLSPVARA